MPRNISFFLTTDQFRVRTKTVTRRVGWLFLKPGDFLNGVEKGQGLKKGEKVNRLGPIRVTAVDREPLNTITQADCVAEGFPELSPAEFVSFFCKTHKGCQPATVVTRIAFEYCEEGGR